MKYEFIDSSKNDIFSGLRGSDLQDLLVQTEKYLLMYRNILGLPKNVTFGCEIEYEGLSKGAVDKYADKHLNNWASDIDVSLDTGGEIKSPVMTDDINCWQELRKICKYLARNGADTVHNAGGHIHVGTCALGGEVEAWRQFLKLYTLYESVIFRFVYGDKINWRAKQLRFARPMADFIYYNLRVINSVTLLLDIKSILTPSLEFDRCFAINFCNVNADEPNNNTSKNTIEFRSPNATTNSIVWQNNINAFTKMLLVARNGKLDEDFLDYKLADEFVPFENAGYMYSMVNLRKVLEFVDLVFDNNLDKVYFLRQYLKDLRDGYNLNTMVRAKRFTK